MLTYKMLKQITLTLLLIFCISGCNNKEDVSTLNNGEVLIVESSEKNVKAPVDVATEYQKLDIEGWSVMISPEVQNDSELYQPIVAQLTKDLKKVKGVVPEAILLKLQKTVIWSEKSMPVKQLNTLFFNGSRKLTKKYNLKAESYGGVILGKTKAYLAVAGFKPWGMLHELTHAYHQFFIKHNFAPIVQAYENIKKTNLHNPKFDKRVKGSGYPTKNKKEYFSELTVAYFAKKLFYPHTRSELAEYDPIGYCAVVSAWGLKGKQQGDIPLLCN